MNWRTSHNGWPPQVDLGEVATRLYHDHLRYVKGLPVVTCDYLLLVITNYGIPLTPAPT